MLARNAIEPLPSSCAGEVIAQRDRRFIVATDTGKLLADRAVSCLVAPRPGDRVLVASVDAEEHYVLAVLRRDESAVELSVPGDLRVDVPGRLELRGAEGLGITSPEEVAIAGGEVSLRGKVGRFALEQMTVLGSRLEAGVAELRGTAGTVDTVFDRVVQRMKHSLRFVEETERVEAANLELSVRETTSLHTKDAVVLADDLIKLDGDQVHVG